MFDLLGIDLSMIHSAVGPTARVLAASRIVRRCAVPPDTASLLAELENDETVRDRNHAAAHDAN